MSCHEWSKGKRTQIMRWKKDNFQIFTFKKIFKDNYYSLRLFLSQRLKTNSGSLQEPG